MSKHMRFFQNSPSRKQILSPFRSFNPLCSQNTDKVSVSTNCQIAKKLYNTSLFPKFPISFGTMFHRIILVLVIYTRYIYIYISGICCQLGDYMLSATFTEPETSVECSTKILMAQISWFRTLCSKHLQKFPMPHVSPIEKEAS